MKRIIIILAAVMLFAACEKQNDSKPTWEDPGISWTDYNSVHDFIYHFRADSLDMMAHLGDTILIEAYNVDHGLDISLCISDRAIEYPQLDWLPTFNTPKSVKEWAAQHFNEKVHVVGTLQFDPILWTFGGPIFSFVDIQLVDK